MTTNNKKNSIIVENPNKLYKSFTVILGALVTILSFLEMYQGTITQFLNGFLTPEQFSVVTFVLGLLIVVGRYIKQPSLGSKR